MPAGYSLKGLAELFDLPDLPKTGRDRLVVAAVDLFYRQGFQAVGIDQVIDKAGVTKTTFYKHFESKDDLMVAAVLRRDEWESAAWARAVQKKVGDDPLAQFLGVFDIMDVWFNDPDFRGCLFINTAIEFPNPYDPVHIAAATHKRKARDMWRDQARAAEIPDPERFADEYTLLFEGALIMRQAHGRNDSARLARAAVQRLIDAHRAPSSPR